MKPSIIYWILNTQWRFQGHVFFGGGMSNLVSSPVIISCAWFHKKKNNNKLGLNAAIDWNMFPMIDVSMGHLIAQGEGLPYHSCVDNGLWRQFLLILMVINPHVQIGYMPNDIAASPIEGLNPYRSWLTHVDPIGYLVVKSWCVQSRSGLAQVICILLTAARQIGPARLWLSKIGTL